MPTYPMLRFVDDAAVGAAVRYDLQTDPARVNSDGFTIGAPQLDGDPNASGRQWGFRRLTMTQEIRADRATAHAMIPALAKELLRDRNWLLFQQSAASKPVWFRTWMTQPAEIDFDAVRATGSDDDARLSRYYITVTVDADPFAYGAKVTLPVVTMGNNPATGTNPTAYVMPAILGDAPAPLRVRVSPAREGATAFLSLLASDTAATTPLLAAAGVAADTTTPSDATAIGGTRHSIPFTVTGMATRLLWSGPALVHGTYKVLARMSTTVPGSTYRVRVNNQYTTPRMLAGATISTMVTSWEWYDLGDMDWPAGARIDGEDFLAPSSTITAAFAVERLTGTGTLYVDAVVLVPVDMEDGQAKTMTVTYPSSEASPNGAFIDAASRSVRLVSSGDVPLQASVPATVLGDFLQVTPGKTNVLRMLATYNTSVAGGDSISTTATLLMSYYPQWLYLADL